MFDYLNTHLAGFSEVELLNNPLLDFHKNQNVSTGEYEKYPMWADYKSLKFIIRSPNFITLTGSIHKYWNEGRNDSDYTFFNIYKTIQDLSKKFNLNPYRAILHNLEFGVNIEPSINPSAFIPDVIIHANTEFNNMDVNDGVGKYCKKLEYKIKIYDKGRQYKLPDFKLRYELQVKRMRFIKCKLGLKTVSIADILQPKNHQILGNMLVKYFDEILIYNKSIQLKSLCEKDRLLLVNGQNPGYWKDLLIKSPAQYYKKKKEFKYLVNIYQVKDSQKEISQLICKKWKFLSAISEQDQEEIQTFLDNWLNSEVEEFLTFSNLPSDEKSEGFPYSSIEGISNHSKAFCKPCILNSTLFFTHNKIFRKF